MKTANDRIFAGLTLLVVLAPLPLASNRPWSWSLLALAAAILALAWCGAQWRESGKSGLPLRRMWLPALLFLLALAWGWLQTLPIFPPSLTHPAWPEAAAALGRPVAAAISGDPEKSIDALMRLMAYGLIFLLAAQLGRARHRANAGLRAVAWSVLFYGAYGLGSHLMDFDYILWLAKWAYLGDATGPFVGRAAFGGYAGIGVLACLALALKARTSRLPDMGAGDRIEHMMARTVPWMVGATFLMFVVLATHSRGALLATVLACAALIAAIAIGRQIQPRHAVLVLLLMGGLIGAAVLVNGDVTLSRMTSESDLTGDRPNLMRLSWTAIADAPLTGHGLGAFSQTFQPYRDLSLPRQVVYGYAHSTWLEVIMDLGWPAGLCLLASLCLPVLKCGQGLVRRRQDQIYPAVALSVAVLLGGQAVFDFTVQIPALAAVFAYSLGIGYSQSFSHDELNDR